MCSRSFPEYFLSASIMVKETTEKVQFYFEIYHEKRTGHVLNCLRKQPTFHDSPLVFQLNDVCRNSTLFTCTCHYPELGCSGISTVGPQTSFRRETIGVVNRPFSQATYLILTNFRVYLIARIFGIRILRLLIFTIAKTN